MIDTGNMMNGFIGKLRRTDAIKAVLFAAIIASMALGDGKQPLGDAVFAGAALCIAVLTGFRLRKIPPWEAGLWAASILYFSVRSVFSDDTGLSLFWVVRLATAFVVFTIPHDNTSRLSPGRWLGALGAVTIGLSITAVAGGFCGRMSDMNLLCYTYGHNHAIDILMFAFPLAVGAFGKAGRGGKAWGAIVLAAILLSFSRMGALLVAAYIMCGVFVGRLSRKWMAPVAAALILAAGTTFMVSLPHADVDRVAGEAVSSVLRRKQDVLSDSRPALWNEAFRAVVERPWTGAGPGTFSLQSVRLQHPANTYSMFAHNFILQTAAESGIPGAVFLLVMLAVPVIRSGRGRSGRNNALLLHGVFLVLLSSLYDYVLDFGAVWLLLWFVLGSIEPESDSRSSGTAVVEQGGIALVAAFYGAFVWASLMPGTLVGMLSPLAVVLDPVRTEAVVSVGNARTIAALRSANPAIIRILLRRAPQAFAPEEKLSMYLKAMAYDPYTAETIRSALVFGIRNPTRFRAIMNGALALDAGQTSIPGSEATPYPAPGDVYLITLAMGTTSNRDILLHRLLYLEGRNRLARPSETESLWVQARNRFPGTGYIYTELASFYLYVKNDPNKARETIQSCRRYESSWSHCVNVKTDLSNLGLPGSYADGVVSF